MGNSMNQTFSTQQMPVMIEAISYAGSAFGVNSNGEQVFINARIVDKCGLQEGMEVVALVLPNYEDKRDHIPWRALRVDDSAQAPSSAPEPVPPTLTTEQVDNMIHAHIVGGTYVTTAEIADELGLDSRTVNNSCNRLFNTGRIVKAVIHSSPNQQRASLLLWAKEVKRFLD